MTNRERVQKALEDAKKMATPKGKRITPKPDAPKPLAKGEKPSKRQRTAAARDARMPTRGRLPVRTMFQHVKFLGDRWTGEMKVPIDNEEQEWKTFTGEAPGVFQLLEELDVMYWEWVASQKGSA